VYVVRALHGAGQLRLTVHAETVGPGGVIMSVLVPGNSKAAPFVTFTEFGVEATPTGHDPAAEYSTCGVVQPSCSVTRTGSAVTLDLGTAAVGDTLIVGVVGKNVRFTTTPHWSVTRSSGLLRVATGTASTWAGTAPRNDTTLRAERFHSASATGGPSGSIAFSAIPCDVAGSGTAVLTQGKTVVERMDCSSLWSSIDSASRRATWSLAGDVVGATGTRTRLAVLDLVPHP
jgi:hypothetical protein